VFIEKLNYLFCKKAAVGGQGIINFFLELFVLVAEES
jgi:hypothetical protein